MSTGGAESGVESSSAWRAALPVFVCFAFVLVLGMAKVSGSSVSLYGEHNRPSAGQARPIRSDEYLQRTPLVLRQVELGFPSSTAMGVGEHDTGILSDLPTSSWLTVLRPQALAYHVLDVERAFAIEWWLVLTAPFVGVYWALWSITRRASTSVLAGLVTMLSPAGLWWSIPTMGMSIGFAGVFCGALVSAGRARDVRAVVGLSLVAGWALAGLATVLYLPWTIGTALTFVPVALVAWIVVRRQDQPVPAWWTLVPLTAVAVVLAVAFAVQHRDALAAIQATVYPGERRARSGEVDLRLLLSAPFDYFAGTKPVVAVNGINQSEAASGYVLWLPVLLVDWSIWRWFRSDDLVRRSTAVVAAATTVMVGWAFLPTPAIIGRLTLLDRVPVERLALPLGVAGVVLAALYAEALRDGHRAPVPAVSVAVSVSAALVLWAGLQLEIDGQTVSRWGVLILTAVTVTAFALLLRGRGVAALAALAALSGFSTLRINPVQAGLDPLTDAPLMAQIEDLRDDVAPSERWVLDGDDLDAYGVLAASGVSLVSGLSWYPDDEAWRVLDPDGADADVWNRFGRVQVALTPDAMDPVLALPFPDVIHVTLGVCSDELRSLGAGVVVSAVALDAPCLRPLGHDPDVPGELWMFTLIDAP